MYLNFLWQTICYSFVFIYRQKRTKVTDKTSRVGGLAKRKAILSVIEHSTSSSSFEFTQKRSVNKHQHNFLCIPELFIYLI